MAHATMGLRRSLSRLCRAARARASPKPRRICCQSTSNISSSNEGLRIYNELGKSENTVLMPLHNVQATGKVIGFFLVNAELVIISVSISLNSGRHKNELKK